MPAASEYATTQGRKRHRPLPGWDEIPELDGVRDCRESGVFPVGVASFPHFPIRQNHPLIPSTTRRGNNAGVDYAKRLSDVFVSTGFTWDGVSTRIGEPGLSGLARNSTIPAADQLDDDSLSALIRLFVLGQSVQLDTAQRALPKVMDDLVVAGWLTTDSTTAAATIEMKPYATDTDWQGWICSDLTPGLDGLPTSPRNDFVLGVSPASTSLAQLTISDQVGSALDVGTGCGIQTLHLATHSDRIVATDINPRALKIAALTTAMNGIAVDLRHGNLFEPVDTDLFDLIITNPPFVMSPLTTPRLTYREGTLPGDELMHRVVTDGARRLAPNGTLQVLGNWAVTDGDWQDRLHSWIAPTGCDALVIERERLDVYTYIEVWLSDAGWDGSPHYVQRYREWLDYFAELGITSVGMGWITLRRTDSDSPIVRMESWPHQVHQPVGPAISASFAQRRTATRDVSELLAATWTVAADVQQETLQHPTSPEPHAIVLRQTSGLGRAQRLTTATAAFVSACDGQLTAAQLVAAIAQLLDVSVTDLVADMITDLVTLVDEGFLIWTQ